MADQRVLKKDQHYKIDENQNLNLHIPTIYPLFKRWARDHSWDGEVLDRNSFIRQLKEAKYYQGYSLARLQEQRKTHKLDLSQMEHLDTEGFLQKRDPELI